MKITHNSVSRWRNNKLADRQLTNDTVLLLRLGTSQKTASQCTTTSYDAQAIYRSWTIMLNHLQCHPMAPHANNECLTFDLNMILPNGCRMADIHQMPVLSRLSSMDLSQSLGLEEIFEVLDRTMFLPPCGRTTSESATDITRWISILVCLSYRMY